MSDKVDEKVPRPSDKNRAMLIVSAVIAAAGVIMLLIFATGRPSALPAPVESNATIEQPSAPPAPQPPAAQTSPVPEPAPGTPPPASGTTAPEQPTTPPAAPANP